jgi:hypothetical protein
VDQATIFDMLVAVEGEVGQSSDHLAADSELDQYFVGYSIAAEEEVGQSSDHLAADFELDQCFVGIAAEEEVGQSSDHLAADLTWEMSYTVVVVGNLAGPVMFVLQGQERSIQYCRDYFQHFPNCFHRLAVP